eukprot:9727773-Alexandrium_andersonii.AAC.1
MSEVAKYAQRKGFKGTLGSFAVVYWHILQRLGCLEKEPPNRVLDIDLFEQLEGDVLLQGLIAG